MTIVAIFLLLSLSIAFGDAGPVNQSSIADPEIDASGNARVVSQAGANATLEQPVFCHAGFYLQSNSSNGEVTCAPCEDNSFMDLERHQSRSCFPCHAADIDHGEVTALNCTQTTDTVIVCQVHFYFRHDDRSSRRCHACDGCVNHTSASFETCFNVCCHGADTLSHKGQGRELALCQGHTRQAETNVYLIIYAVCLCAIVLVACLVCYWKFIYTKSKSSSKRNCIGLKHKNRYRHEAKELIT
ncbi:uncharacterized protein LOC131928238 isoform X2 [Physella acuta]|nr:uncharacterized protein LOC131928238 isoform X2 [Physella acuta]